ncbi:hypothetical protein QWZ12_13170 [Methylobacterium adhaesivum]|uniref:Alpha-D-phosphohexomutase alpha/beta/alpha domain-containing protein n=1 Tax=Methylobacterium adhaesivum TaxID=333297 RepID=A0ABT8BHJ2_9HYPH|nr:hypothetical protein [Methylobacterium adhaesivum]MDN3591556.1 hypothetical protein [Methylobacterium adhaesivum]
MEQTEQGRGPTEPTQGGRGRPRAEGLRTDGRFEIRDERPARPRDEPRGRGDGRLCQRFLSLRCRDGRSRAQCRHRAQPARQQSRRRRDLANAAAAGFRVVDCGAFPTPALALGAMRRGSCAVMVTGSHLPEDRNGLKF